MKTYGYILGVKLIKDTHHDEVFIEHNGLIVMENNIWQFDSCELVAIAKDILQDKKDI